jgi:hypothetical protein
MRTWLWQVGENPGHFVLAEASWWSGLETVWVDGKRSSNKHTWRFESEYPVEVAGKAATVIFSAGWRLPRARLLIGTQEVSQLEDIDVSDFLSARLPSGHVLIKRYDPGRRSLRLFFSVLAIGVLMLALNSLALRTPSLIIRTAWILSLQALFLGGPLICATGSYLAFKGLLRRGSSKWRAGAGLIVNTLLLGAIVFTLISGFELLRPVLWF